MAQGGFYDDVEWRFLPLCHDRRLERAPLRKDGRRPGATAEPLPARLPGHRAADLPGHGPGHPGLRRRCPVGPRARLSSTAARKPIPTTMPWTPPGRAEREAPYVDKTAYTERNAAVASAYMLASAVLNEPRYADLAIRALEFIWQKSYQEGLGMHHYFDNQPHVPGLLADQVSMAQAWLDAYEHFGREVYLQRAETLMRFADNALRDDDGRYFDTVAAPEAVGRLRRREKPFCENVSAAEVNLRLYRLTGREEYRQSAQQTLEALVPYYPDMGYRGRPLCPGGGSLPAASPSRHRGGRERGSGPGRAAPGCPPRLCPQQDRPGGGSGVGAGPPGAPGLSRRAGAGGLRLPGHPLRPPDRRSRRTPGPGTGHARPGTQGARRGLGVQGLHRGRGLQARAPASGSSTFSACSRTTSGSFATASGRQRRRSPLAGPIWTWIPKLAGPSWRSACATEGHSRVQAKIDAGAFENWLLDLRGDGEEELILEERDA